MTLLKTVLLLFYFSSSVLSSPVPHKEIAIIIESEAIINCNDPELIEKMTLAGIPYSCNSDTEFPKDSINNVYFNKKFKSPTSRCDDSSVYVPDVGKCVPRYLRTSSSSNTNGIKEIFYKPNFPTLPSGPCEDGYAFDTKERKCSPDNQFISVSIEDMDTTSFDDKSSSFKVARCGDGSVFVAEIGICLPANPHVATQSDQKGTETVAIAVSASHKCPPGTVYSPEVDLCLTITKPGSVPKPAELSQVNKSPSKPETSKDGNSKENKGRKCEPGFVYVSEIDHCMPHERPQSDSQSRPKVTKRRRTSDNTTPDPFRLTLAPLTKDQVGRRKCEEGTVYVSEIDLCLTP